MKKIIIASAVALAFLFVIITAGCVSPNENWYEPTISVEEAQNPVKQFPRYSLTNPYDTLYENIEKFESQSVMIDAKIQQLVFDDNNIMKCHGLMKSVTNSPWDSDEPFYFYYNGNNGRLLEGTIYTVYCEPRGFVTYETTAGTENTVVGVTIVDWKKCLY